MSLEDALKKGREIKNEVRHQDSNKLLFEVATESDGDRDISV
ncbi:hypothetical protein [Wolbachia endosymbiont of Wuchereria bancrofti]|nr:hypothetical protein [Wolbachia endosymbiont of Wuchereria bancrofti]